MIEMVADRLFTAIFCCDVDPESEDAFDRVDVLLMRFPNGTEKGWRCLRPEDAERFGAPWDRAKPVPCKEHPNRWHYVAIVQGGGRTEIFIDFLTDLTYNIISGQTKEVMPGGIYNGRLCLDQR